MRCTVGNWYRVIANGLPVPTLDSLAFAYPICHQSDAALYALAHLEAISQKSIPQVVRQAALDEWRRRFDSLRHLMSESWQIEMNRLVWPNDQ